jgi:hypothetical protein
MQLGSALSLGSQNVPPKTLCLPAFVPLPPRLAPAAGSGTRSRLQPPRPRSRPRCWRRQRGRRSSAPQSCRQSFSACRWLTAMRSPRRRSRRGSSLGWLPRWRAGRQAPRRPRRLPQPRLPRCPRLSMSWRWCGHSSRRRAAARGQSSSRTAGAQPGSPQQRTQWWTSLLPCCIISCISATPALSTFPLAHPARPPPPPLLQL